MWCLASSASASVCGAAALQPEPVSFVALHKEQLSIIRAWSRVVAAAVLLLLASAQPAAAHSQLVSSIPGSGEVLATSPPRAQLVFSEPVDPEYSGFDLLDSQGRVLASGLGSPDPSDPRVLDAPLPELASGAYTIPWHALSATDGHATQGFIVFAVGDASLPPGAGVGTPGGVGDVHAGHGGNEALIEALARSLADAGFMAAFGLAMVYLAVRGTGSVSMASVAWAACAGLILAAAGSLLLSVSSASNTGDSNPIDYLTGARSGSCSSHGWVSVSWVPPLSRSWRVSGDSRSIPVAGLAGLAGLALIAAGGHAAAFTSFVPLANRIRPCRVRGRMGGWPVLPGVGDHRSTRPAAGPRGHRSSVLRAGPRFGLARGAVRASAGPAPDGRPRLAGDGVWTAPRDQDGVVLAALCIGACELPARCRRPGRRLGFDRRVVAESGLAVVVVVLSADLASGSPPGALKPVPIAQATSSALDVIDMSMSLLPGRAGPTR